MTIDESWTPGRAESRRRWARLIQRVFEVDPLACPKCGNRMRVIGFIERHQRERILRHLGLWERPTSRAPPRTSMPDAAVRELQYVPVLDQVTGRLGVDGQDELPDFDVFDLCPEPDVPEIDVHADL